MAVTQKREWCTLKMEKVATISGNRQPRDAEKGKEAGTPSQPLEGAGLPTSGPIRELIGGNLVQQQ